MSDTLALPTDLTDGYGERTRLMSWRIATIFKRLPRQAAPWSPRRMTSAAAGSSPIDIIVIGFEGNQFNGAIAPEIMRLIETQTVRLIDIAFVSKDAAGAITSLTGVELANGASTEFPDAELVQPGALGIDDVSEVGDDLAEQSSALIIALENTWAGAFITAVRESNGEVLRFNRIPSDLARITLEQSAGGTEAH